MRRRSCPTRIPEGFHDSVAAHLGDFTQSADEAVVHVDVEVKVGYRLSYPARAGRGPCSATIGDAAKTSSATRLHAAPLLSHPPQRCHPSVFFSIRSLPRRKTVQKGERLWFERRQTSFSTVGEGVLGPFASSSYRSFTVVFVGPLGARSSTNALQLTSLSSIRTEKMGQ